MRQRRKRRYCTASESAEIWDRWQKGEGLKSIGRVFGKSSGSIFSHICPTGGIRPPPRRRSRLGVDAGRARGDLPRVGERALAAGYCLRMGRAPSTVSREIGRNGWSRLLSRCGLGSTGLAVGHCGPRRVSWPHTRSCGESSRGFCQRNWSPQQNRREA